MNQHQQIVREMERQYEFLQDAVIVGPSAIAYGVFREFSTGEEDAQIQYTSLEHLKHMARVFLGKKKDPDSDDNEAHGVQSSFEFSGTLQDRYPLPRAKDQEPAYKLRSMLTSEERAWNVGQLRKSANSRLEHADALEAEGLVAA